MSLNDGKKEYNVRLKVRTNARIGSRTLMEVTLRELVNKHPNITVLELDSDVIPQPKEVPEIPITIENATVVEP